MTKVRRTQAQWQQLIDEQPSSGLTVSDYCQQHRIAVSGFYYWRNKLADTQAAPADWLTFAPADGGVTNSHTRWQMELALPGGITLRLNRFD